MKQKARDHIVEEREKGTDSTPVTPTNASSEQEQAGRSSGEVEEFIDRIKRLQAEFENYKKRIARDAVALEERTSDQTILSFLPLYDSLQLAFANYHRDEDLEAFVSGIERIFSQFQQILEQAKVSQVHAIGEKFDPAVHEALLSVASEKERNTIMEEFSPGYVRNGRTLRPSKVAVSQGPAQVEEEQE